MYCNCILCIAITTQFLQLAFLCFIKARITSVIKQMLDFHPYLELITKM